MRDVEAQLNIQVDDGPPRKKRRGGDIGRDWKCDYDDCGKDFKSVSFHKSRYTQLSRVEESPQDPYEYYTSWTQRSYMST